MGADLKSKLKKEKIQNAKFQTEKFQVDGMTCTGCEKRIEKALEKLPGLVKATASFSKGQVSITWDPDSTDEGKIRQTLEKLGYAIKPQKQGMKAIIISKILPAGGIILLAAYMIFSGTAGAAGLGIMPEAGMAAGYGMLFFTGLITSLHCAGMCGGIALSLAISQNSSAQKNNFWQGKNPPTPNFHSQAKAISKIKPSLLYNIGRVLSYTVIGGLAGALGSSVSLTGTARGIVAIAAGGFMVLMALNMLGILPGRAWLGKIIPRLPAALSGKIYEKLHREHNANRGQEGKNTLPGSLKPFFVGLLNGLMPCGPLQAMQFYALGTGSFAAGALSMLAFSLGTVPLMFGVGAVSSLLSGNFTRRMMKAGAVLVLLLGLVMTNRGLALTGLTLPTLPILQNPSSSNGIAVLQGQIQTVVTRLSPGSYQPITVQKGIPVRWIIKADKKDINGCNNEIIIPRYNISVKLKPGDNIIEFTPREAGTITYSCWMGMIRSNITVVEDISEVRAQITKKATA